MALVGRLHAGERAPAGEHPLVAGGRPLRVTAAEGLYGVRDIGDRLVGPQRLVVDQVHEPAVVELDERVRVERLEPATEVLDARGDRTVFHGPSYDAKRAGDAAPRPRHCGDVEQGAAQVGRALPGR